MQERIVTTNEAGQRLDKFLAKYMDLAPQSFFYKMLRKKNITLNGKKADGREKLAEGDLIRLFLSDETIDKFSKTKQTERFRYPRAKDMPEIVYEDEHILLMNKPVGMLSQKAKDTDVSAVEYLIGYLLESGQLTVQELQTFRPSVCNRLDRNTSGLLAAGKSLIGLQTLSLFFKERSLAKYYLCPVVGKVTDEQEIDGWLEKDEKTNKVTIYQEEHPDADRIRTAYRPLVSTADATLLEVHLITGKTHQIRAHLASEGHPVIGDYKYGNRSVNERLKKAYGLHAQLLHAWRLEMPRISQALPELCDMKFTAEPPTMFEKICEELFGETAFEQAVLPTKYIR